MNTHKEEQRLYEGMYIFDTSLSEEGKHKLLDKVTSSIVDKRGKIHKIFDQGRKKLAYEINKKRDGYYVLLFFSVSAHMIDKLWKEYRLNENILRFITLQVEKVPEAIEFQSLEEG